MKENEEESIDVFTDQKSPYKRPKPDFKKNSKRKKNNSKNILEEQDSSAMIELSTKNDSNPGKRRLVKMKSNTIYKSSMYDEKTTENLILENKRKLTRLTKKHIMIKVK